MHAPCEALDACRLAEWVREAVASGGRVIVCEIDCDAVANAPDVLAALEATLDTHERDAVLRLTRPTQRRRTAVVRGALRQALAACLDVPAELVRLVRSADGRTLPVTGPGAEPWQVSLSHSAPVGAFAIAAGTAIGVDVEHISGLRFAGHIADHMLHAREAEHYGTLPASIQAAWLARAWVCKEALLKAMGLGLRIDPRIVEVMPGDWDEDRQSGTFALPDDAAWSGRVWRRGDVLTAVAVQGPSRCMARARLVF